MEKRSRADTLKAFYDRIAAGRTLEEQLEAVRQNGCHGLSPVLRLGVLSAHDIANPREWAEQCLLFGCYRPFTTPQLLHDAIRLLEYLGVGYTWLEKEYCCGLPLLSQAETGERERLLDESRSLLQRNLDLARGKGADKIIYCCAGCAQVAKGLFPQQSGKHAYILDALLDALEGRSLGVEPKVIGYFEGCHSSYKQQFPDVDLDWKRYRAFLGRVSGLEVLDIKGLCCKQQAVEVVDRALEQRLDTIVCACSGCSASLRNAGRGKVRVLSYPGLLARILGLEE